MPGGNSAHKYNIVLSRKVAISVKNFRFKFSSCCCTSARAAYERMRGKYGADAGAFPHLYDKVRPEVDVFKIGKEYADPL